MDHVMLVPTTRKLSLPTPQSPLASLQSTLEELNATRHLSESERWDRYRNIFQSFFSFKSPAPGGVAVGDKEQVMDPIAIELRHLFSDKNAETAQRHLLSMMTTIPAMYQKRMLQMLKILASSSDIEQGQNVFSPDGYLVHQGDQIPSSNLVDLVNFASRKRKTVTTPPAGWTVFLDWLVRSNVPREYYVGQRTTDVGGKKEQQRMSRTQATCRK